jgi:predicted kinase
VRAKVASLRAQQQQEDKPREKAREECRAYLRLAGRYAARLARQIVIVVRGLAGSGKSTLARAIADSLGARVLSTDTLRKQMPPHGDRYSDAGRGRVYERLLKDAGEELADGIAVVLDGTFLKRAWRERAAMLAESRGAELVMVRVDCPAEIARERIAARLARGGSDSEARPELLAVQEREEEPDPPEAEVLVVDGTLAIAAQLEEVERALR